MSCGLLIRDRRSAGLLLWIGWTAAVWLGVSSVPSVLGWDQLAVAQPTGEASAAAQKRRWPICQVEQVLASSQRIRVLARLMTAGGEQILNRRPLALVPGGRTLACDPPGCRSQRRPFSQARSPLWLALLWESSLPYRAVQADVQGALADLVGRLPKEVKLWPAALGGRTVRPLLPRTAADVRAALRSPQASPSADQTDVPLIEGIRAALSVLSQPAQDGGASGAEQLPPRKAIVVVASGMDLQMLPRRFVQLGDELARAEIPLYAVAVSPRNHQLPMLNLAELSFRSHGTFRWVRLLPDLPQQPLVQEQLDALWNELASTEEVTFFGPTIEALLAQPGRPTELALDCGVAVSRSRPVHTVQLRAVRRPWLPGVTVLCALALAGLSLLLWLRRWNPARGSQEAA